MEKSEIIFVRIFEENKGENFVAYESKELYEKSEVFLTGINHQFETITFFKEESKQNQDHTKEIIQNLTLLKEEIDEVRKELKEKADAKTFEEYLEKLEQRLFQRNSVEAPTIISNENYQQHQIIPDKPNPSNPSNTPKVNIVVPNTAPKHTMGDMLQSHVRRWGPQTQQAQQNPNQSVPGVMRPAKKNQ